MNQKTVFIVITLILALHILICETGCKNKKGTEFTKVSLRLAWIPGATFIGDYVALDKGFWKDEGLDVVLNPGGFEQDAIKLVAGNADTFGITSGPQLLYARASKVPIVAIGSTIPRSPIGWIAKKNTGIKEPKDFVGKKVGAQFGTHTEITLEALLAKLDIPLDSLDRIPVKFDPKPFISGQVDVLPVYIIDQPIDLERQGLELNVIDPGDYSVSLAYGNLYFTTEKTLKKKPEIVRAFIRGATRGWVWANENREEAVEILSKYVPGADQTILLEKLNSVFDFINKNEQRYQGIFPMKVTEWDETREILSRFGNLKFKSLSEELFTNKFLIER